MNKKSLLTVPLAILVTKFALCQLQPGSSPGWTVVSNMSDEFNSGTSYDPSKWTWDPLNSNCNGSTCLDGGPSNISVQSGVLKLSVVESPCDCIAADGQTLYFDHTSGTVFGLNSQQYGYFEVRMKVPDPAASPHTYSGLSANAWLWANWLPFNGFWDEIDLAEIDPSNNRHTCNRVWDPTDGGIDNGDKISMRCENGDCTYYDFILTPGWHTYGAVWHPNGIAIYVDGVLINKTTIGCPAAEPLNWVLGPCTGEQQFVTSITPLTLFPYVMEVDYVRTYKLLMDCANVINTCSFNFASHDNKVKKSITIGGPGCTNLMPVTGTGSNVALRANDFIEINGDFTVPVGAQLSMEIIGCY